jgi:hypothetical protein
MVRGVASVHGVTSGACVTAGASGIRSLGLALGAAAALAAAATPQTVVAKLGTSPASPANFFGAALSTDRGTLAVAEPLPDDSGVVHVFDHEGTVPGAGWIERAAIEPHDGAPGQRFGASLSLSFDTLLVGAPGDSQLGSEAGAVYVYARDRKGTEDEADDTWIGQGKLHPQGVSVPVRFGSVVSLAVDTAVIGGGSPDANSAFVFVRDDKGTADPLDDSFVQQQQLQQVAGPGPTTFGLAAGALPNELMVVVADTLPSAFAPTGTVSVFVRDASGTPDDPLDDTWALEDVLLPDDTTGGIFGTQLALGAHGRRLFVTAAQAGPSSAGRVTAFDHDNGVLADLHDDTWTRIGTLEPPAGPYAGFGDALATRNDLALISSIGFTSGPPSAGGSTFLYQRVGDVWQLVTGLRAPDEAVGDGYGAAVAFGDDDTAFVGSPGGPYVDDEPAVEGAVYALEIGVPNPWTLPGYPAIPSIAGWGGLLPDEPMTLRLYNSFDAGVPELLVIGLSIMDASFKGLTLVPAPFVILPLALGPDGSLSLTVTWPAAGLAPPGTSLIFQGWIPPQAPGFPWAATPGLVATLP